MGKVKIRQKMRRVLNLAGHFAYIPWVTMQFLSSDLPIWSGHLSWSPISLVLAQYFRIYSTNSQTSPGYWGFGPFELHLMQLRGERKERGYDLSFMRHTESRWSKVLP